ncbi:MAG: NAD(+)/NADH kinase [Verrucomicrobium sp.]|nr:NAD(+)/NADH kinase [Verrucomicrobium sp.]
MKIGVVANRSKPQVSAVLRQLAAMAADYGATLHFEAATARLAGQKKGLALPALCRKIDLLVVVGGDGSLLRVVHDIYPSPVPILGVNVGHLGFLTAIKKEEVAAVFGEVFAGHLRYSPRRPFRLKVHSRGRAPRVIPCALNDIVANRSSSSMAVIRVEVDGTFVNEYVADGLVVSTSTGSTAYSLAAGGPILSPESCGILVTPICPHSLSNRSLLLPAGARLRVEAPPQPRRIDLQYDGVDGGSLRAGDWAEIDVAEKPVTLAFLKHRDFFQILREKLKWRGAVRDEIPQESAA